MKKNTLLLFLVALISCEKTPIGLKSDFTFTQNFTSVDFNNISENATAFEWDFGDGSIDTKISPKHIFPKCNTTYSVVLTAKNKNLKDTSVQQIYCPCDLSKVAGTYLFSGKIDCYNPSNMTSSSSILADSIFSVSTKDNKNLIIGDKSFQLVSSSNLFHEFRFGTGSNYGVANYKISKDSLFLTYRSGGIAGGCTTNFAGKKQ